ncbi:MAG TPA: hypothetical protein PLZ36_07085 [Armatimonadota bacterium]|nr:hypothetical protein [Armatimonadota bacterium]
MSKWIRGRHGRPIASILTGLVLIAVLSPLAPLPAQAQPSQEEINKLFGVDIVKPVPIVVFDYVNRSNHRTGMLGRVFTDALSIELLNTKKFAVKKRAELETILAQENLTVPLTNSAQALVAERFADKPPYMVSGEIEAVKIINGRDGAFAEVTVSTLVISVITKLPINGARVVQRSSPKIGFSGNPDVLVQEALATAAYQTSYTLLNNRLPIATVLTSVWGNEVQLKGGSTLGLREGMVLTTMRRGTVTGTIRLTMVNPAESNAVVLEQRGMALGDKAVPVFDLKPTTHVSPAQREKAGMQIVSILALGALLGFVSGDAGNDDLKASTTPVAVSLADAHYMNYPYGANLVRWSVPHKDKIVAYVIYRDANPFAPVAVVARDVSYYIDSATPIPTVGDVMENTEVEIEIEEDTGHVTITRTVDYAQDLQDLQNPEVTDDLTSYTVTCRRVPLNPGETTGYQVAVVYKDYDMSQQEQQDQLQFRLFVGDKGPTSRRITLLTPPMLDTPLPGVLSVDGNYRCESVVGASTYNLQVSPDSTFGSRTINVEKKGQSGVAYQVVNLPLQTLYDTYPAASNQTLYWRIGARKDAEPRPDYYSDPQQFGWVYSDVYSFDLPAAPPRSRATTPGVGPPEKGQGAGRGGIDARTRKLRR